MLSLFNAGFILNRLPEFLLSQYVREGTVHHQAILTSICFPNAEATLSNSSDTTLNYFPQPFYISHSVGNAHSSFLTFIHLQPPTPQRYQNVYRL